MTLSQRIPILIAFLLLSRPTFAFSDGPITAMIAAEQKAYNTFMRLQMVQQMKALAANYKASVAYYDLYKQLNSGEGIARNAIGYLGDTQRRYIQDTKNNILSDWATSKGEGSDVDKYIKGLNERAGKQVKAVGDQLENAIFAQRLGASMEKQSGRLSPTAAQNEILRAQAIQIQLLAQMNATMLQTLNYQIKADADQKAQMAQEWKMYQDSLKSANDAARSSGNPFEQGGF